ARQGPERLAEELAAPLGFLGEQRRLQAGICAELIRGLRRDLGRDLGLQIELVEPGLERLPARREFLIDEVVRGLELGKERFRGHPLALAGELALGPADRILPETRAEHAAPREVLAQ